MSIGFSVVIPTYNRATFLLQAIESIYASDTLGLLNEIVVSDNASTDNTYDVVQALKDPRIQYYRNDKNEGIALNMIHALERATGDYCVLLSDDDVLVPEILDKFAEILMHEENIGVILGSYQTFRGNDVGTVLGVHRDFVESRSFEAGQEAFENLFLLSHHMSRIVLRRDLLDLDGAYQWVDGLYPNMFLVGSALKRSNGYYVVHPTISVRIGNKKNWSYTDNYMLLNQREMAHALLQREPYGAKCYAHVARLIVRDSYHALKLASEEGRQAFGRLVVLLSRIPEFRFSTRFWSYVILFSMLGKSGISLARHAKKTLQNLRQGSRHNVSQPSTSRLSC